ncbi:MAG: DUF4280 domain-containing protein [Flavobacteriaceae bacterium]|nr:DUF4280 domain-containing protein [Flavobacteriaceae bacterium]
MGNKQHLVCQGAMCKCQYGTAPDKLMVNSHQEHYINDNAASKKLLMTHQCLQQPLEKKTFGSCNFSYPSKPCQVQITQWQDPYDSIQLQADSGYPLLEKSKAICAIAGSPCIEIMMHGQQLEPSSSQFEESTTELCGQLNPIVAPNSVNKPNGLDNLKLD